MFIDFLNDRFAEARDAEAIVWNDQSFSYGWLLERVAAWQCQIGEQSIPPGTVVALEADFSPTSVALFLALVDQGCIVVPLTEAVAQQRSEFIEIARVQFAFSVEDEQAQVTRLDGVVNHPIYQQLRQRQHPGLVLFSSGSTGKNKAAVHDLVPLLEKFKVRRNCLRTLVFLLFDHIGGVNTMLYTLSNAGCLVTVGRRDPDAVLAAVQRHRVQLLPTSPTFMNLVLLSEAYRRHDLSTLQTVTYGTEPMPASTLERFHALLPGIRLQQTYGLSEVGILRSKSRGSDSLWVKVGGEGYQTRIVDGILQIKAESAMLGYLNAPSPFSEDGWFITGDAVEQDGEYLRILGRQTEMINVGGQKVFPAEVESVMQRLDNVQDVTVHGERNTITGQMVCARVTLQHEEDPKQLVRRLKRACREQLEPFKVPAKIAIVAGPQHGARYKRMRQRAS